MVAVALLVFTVGEMICMPVSGAYVASMAPETMRGRYSAAVGLTWNLGHATAPGLGLVLYHTDPGALWWSCLALGLLSAGLMLLPLQGRDGVCAESKFSTGFPLVGSHRNRKWIHEIASELRPGKF